ASPPRKRRLYFIEPRQRSIGCRCRRAEPVGSAAREKIGADGSFFRRPLRLRESFASRHQRRCAKHEMTHTSVMAAKTAPGNSLRAQSCAIRVPSDTSACSAYGPTRTSLASLVVESIVVSSFHSKSLRERRSVLPHGWLRPAEHLERPGWLRILRTFPGAGTGDCRFAALTR